MAFVVILRNEKLISIRDVWIQNPTIGGNSLIYFSPTDDDVPDFSLQPEYFFSSQTIACYIGRVEKRFGMYIFGKWNEIS